MTLEDPLTDVTSNCVKVMSYGDLHAARSFTYVPGASVMYHAILTRLSWFPIIFCNSFLMRPNFIIVSLENMDHPKANPG